MTLRFSCVLLGLGSVAPGGETRPHAQTYVSTYEVIATFPHEPEAFTQGLAFDYDGTLYESDGLYRHSAVRSVDPQSGKDIKRVSNAESRFGEGIVVLGDRLLQLCWKCHVLNEYSLPSLTFVRSVPLNVGKEGWGLATDGALLYLTDSGSSLYHLEPGTYKLLATLPIRDPRLSGGKLIYGVNELEWVAGELWGNVYPMYQRKHSECIVRINATSGQVNGWIDMRGLLAQQRGTVKANAHSYVLNGIAYHPPSQRLYVTGKKWDYMYQVRLQAAPQLGPQHVAAVCNLG